jgi:adenylate kinase family enzyme
MKKIVVIGSGGSGKSTFSRRLGEKLGIPVVHLDKLFWRPNWTRTPEDEWIETLRREIARDEWIMDGNFGATREMRLQACDTVIFLDMPRWLCMYRILKRTILFHRNTRPDMAEGCHERFNLEFLLWVWNYPKGGRHRVIDELKRYGDRKIITLESRNDVESFLTEVG